MVTRCVVGLKMRALICVTHHQMPRVTGLELNKSLKNKNNTQAIPVIFYSGQLTVDLKLVRFRKEHARYGENRSFFKRSLIWLLKHSTPSASGSVPVPVPIFWVSSSYYL